MTDRTEGDRLWGRGSWEGGASSAVPQLVFGELVKLATPVVKRYQSDLYHDARWLGAQLAQTFEGAQTERFEFFYAVSAWGTSIGTERDLVKLRLTEEGDRFYRVAVTNRDDTWHFEARVLCPHCGKDQGPPLGGHNCKEANHA